MKIIVAITGGSGIVLAKRLLEELKEKKNEVHLIISDSAKKVAGFEKVPVKELEKLADRVYDFNDVSENVASGSFDIDAMVVVPCSMKTIAGLASGYSDNLILRAGDVCLKQGRKVILVPRETPLGYIHLRNMKILKRAGATILPPNLAFYFEPKTLDDMINFIIGKILDSLNIGHNLYRRWERK